MTETSAILYTVGHSNRALAEFLALLGSANIATLIDVRARPRATRWPHFSGPKLARSLEESGIGYRWLGDGLGGFRTPSAVCRHIALDETLRGFAEHMETEEFRRTSADLKQSAMTIPTAIMCAEKDPNRCHRRLIADYMELLNLRVVHLVDADTRAEHRTSAEARREGANLIYDRVGRPSLWTE